MYTPVMSKASIFEEIVRYENEHTQLLCNLLNQFGRFRSLMFRFLTGEEIWPKIDFMSNHNGRTG
jgi:hypothetical protein